MFGGVARCGWRWSGVRGGTLAGILRWSGVLTVGLFWWRPEERDALAAMVGVGARSFCVIPGNAA